MGCSSCGPEGCGDKGHCATGGCNKMNTYDWISTLDINDPAIYNYVEVSFKNGARKDFFLCNDNIYQYHTGDVVVVECSPGYDVGQITLMGELVRMQMKKKSVPESRITDRIVRKANERDSEKLGEARILEKRNLVRARVISRSLGLELKLGDIEYQADLKKATFYYTANGRVDFRELVREYAKEFRIKIEMRQIGSRQESARLGGLGSCGRELCCSTWLSDFKSVNTAAARYQNISINQTKLSGQCGRLKCCLNYELDTYLDALKDFPKRADVLKTMKGRANLVKTDIFKGLMFYVYDDISLRGAYHPLDKDKVKEILALNAKGEKPADLLSFYTPVEILEADKEIEFADVTGVIELPAEVKKKKSRKSNRNKKGPRTSSDSTNRPNTGDNSNPEGQKSRQNKPRNSRNKNSRGPRPEGDQNANKDTNQKAQSDKPANNSSTQGEQPSKGSGNQPNKSNNNRNSRNKKRPNTPGGPNPESGNAPTE